MRKALHSGVAAIALVASGVVLAEVATDGTMGAKVRLTGRDVTVGHALGTIKGKNLFHSFGRFDIETGGSATFTGPAGLNRVISRVTGGDASSIDGTLRSTIPGADFYFINPAGILFGPNARLDVPASFHASAASELRFPDGGVFSASNPERTVLSVAAPEAFGFLGARPAGITLNQGRLEVGTGKSLSLVGGAIAVIGNGVAEEAGIVRAPGGELTLASLGGKGEVSLLGDASLFDPGNDPAFRQGRIVLAGGPLIDSSGDGGGSIRIRTGRLRLASGASVFADNVGASDATGGVIVDARHVRLDPFAQLTADAFAAGAAGNVGIRTSDLKLDGGALDGFTGIASRALPGSTGRAGTLTIEANGTLALRRGALLSSTTFAGNDAGQIIVNAGRLVIDGSGTANFTGIASQAAPSSTGAAGDVVIGTGRGSVIRNGGAVASNTFASGDAGSVTFDTRGLTIDGSAMASLPTGILSLATGSSTGAAGTVTITGAALGIKGGGTVTSSTLASGDAGTVAVRVGRLTVVGAGPNLASSVTSTANPGSTGTAGDVVVEVEGRLALVDSGTIASSTFGTGAAGTVDVEAGTIFIDAAGSSRFTGITSGAEAGSTGAAGAVTATTKGDLDIRSGGEISSFTFGIGNAGRVTVRAGRATLDGRGTGRFTGISGQAETDSSGAAGSVSLTVEGPLVIQNGEIGSTSFGAGPAGDVSVVAGTLSSERGAISSIAFSAEGGRVRITSTGRLALVESLVSTNGTLADDEASVIGIAAPTVIVVGKSEITALTGDGRPLTGAGIVDIKAERAFISEDSVVRGSSSTIISGLVNSLRTPERLSAETPTDPSRLLRDCAEERLGGRGSFKAAGRGGLPASPEEFLAGRAAASTGRGAILTSADCAR